MSSHARLITLAVALSVTSSALAEDHHRPLPNYDSRPPVASDATDALLWIPRVLTSPLYFVSELVIRQPLAALDTWAEQNRIPQLVFHFFTFGPHDDAGVFPTAFYEFGFMPSVGLYAYWKNFLAPGNRISAHAATWGLDWLSFTLADRARIDSHLSFFSRVQYLERQDYLFGVQDSQDGHRTITRYSAQHLRAELGYELRVGRSALTVSGAVVEARFGNTDYGHDDNASLVAYSANNGGTLPAGFAEGYGAASLRVKTAFDTREPSGIPSGGIRLAGSAELAGTFAGLTGSRWVRLDGEALAASDFLGERRTLSIGTDVALILPFDGAPIPFDETIDFGGFGPMEGYLPGYLRGLSAVSVTLAYEWPIWVFINARLFVSTGSAFGERFAGFALDRLRLDFGLAIKPNDPGDHPFEAGLAVGTEPFGIGGNVDSVRFFVGGRNTL